MCAATVALPTAEAGTPDVAALQWALLKRGLYHGALNGDGSSATDRAVRAAQRRAGLIVDGVVGPKTSKLLRLRTFGSRQLRLHRRGSDVVALQFALAAHGFPSGVVDGVYGDHTEAAVRRFQRFAGLTVDGDAGGATFDALRRPPPSVPYPLLRPLDGSITDGFGPRGLRFHAGADIPAPQGTAISAAAPGRVSWAGWRDGGWGLLVVVADPDDVRTMYAHLSRVDVSLGQRVKPGSLLGQVGSTGDATGPHLHFEVRVRGAAVNPEPALGLLSP